AAFMSTVSTLINWSASYLTNDIYARFLRPRAGDRELVAAARVASVIVTVIGATAAFYAHNVTTVYRLILAVGTGPGLVLILRWYWWRINAWAELTAMVAGFLLGAFFMWRIADFGMVLTLTAVASLAVWVPVMLLTRPESEEKLEAFYRRVRPGGPGWRRQRERTGLPSAQDLRRDLARVGAGLMVLFGAMFSIGGLLLLRYTTMVIMAVVGVVGYFWLHALGRPREADEFAGPGPEAGVSRVPGPGQ
ncbi:MAG: sodium:proline symporter, partial [Gemmatimonadota bacterium]